MTLAEVPRQILAGGLASAAFLSLFFGLQLNVGVSLALAVVVYGAFLLLIRRRPTLAEQIVDTRISRADIKASADALNDAAERITDAAEAVPSSERHTLERMGELLRAIRDHVYEDPQDYRSTRRFVQAYLPTIIESIEGYARLSRQSRGAQSARLASLGARIQTYLPLLEQIEHACLENDFAELEAQVDALATQLDRRLR
ncbi:MAG: 5-bromo-4-chloroindolyl phosphate hydrolysis family protein [Pseudomonadota bacterium]